MNQVKIKSQKSIKPSGLRLDDATFQSLRFRITRSSGIHISPDESSRFILERRLAPRLRAKQVASFSDYERLLDETEMNEVLDTVAIHETYFFREKRQLKAFADHVLPDIAQPRKPLKIWSAGCSTGEEAYTIAILLAERGLLDGGAAQIVASDLSRRVIESGVRGVYGPSSFRTTEAVYKDRYFAQVGKGLWQACDRLRDSVAFEHLNLVELLSRASNGGPPAGARYGAIFCRNVLMYFDEKIMKSTLELFHSLLVAGGYLLLGHAESLLPLGTSFVPVQFGRELAYRK